jgi:hypothetical protein
MHYFAALRFNTYSPTCSLLRHDLQTALLDEFSTSEKHFRHVLQANMELLCEGIVPTVIQAFEGFAALNYLISEEQYSQYTINDPFMQQFVATLDSKLAFHKVPFLFASFGLSISGFRWKRRMRVSYVSINSFLLCRNC